jgi:hypothetical protein
MNKTAIRLMCAVLCLVMFAAPMAATAQMGKSSDFMQGKVDGEKDAKGEGWWYWVGCAGGLLSSSVVGLGLAFLPLIIKPTVPSDKLMGKTPEYVQGYTEGWQAKAQKINLKYALFGCGTGGLLTIVGIVIYVVAVMSVATSTSTY